MDKGARDKLAGSPGVNGGGQDAQKDLHARTGRDETKRKTQERMERRSRKRSSSAGSDKMERVGDRKGKMERYCSIGQSPQRTVAPTEEEEEYGFQDQPYSSSSTTYFNDLGNRMVSKVLPYMVNHMFFTTNHMVESQPHGSRSKTPPSRPILLPCARTDLTIF
jgi:hypothetical protein